MTDLALARELINRGALSISFGPPLKTGGVYVLAVQPASHKHPARQRIVAWLIAQSMPLASVETGSPQAEITGAEHKQ